MTQFIAAIIFEKTFQNTYNNKSTSITTSQHNIICRKMIKFQSQEVTSIVLPSAIFSLLIILCCLTSLSLNPVIFLFNRRRKSIAAFLFATLSSFDFLYCAALACLLLFQANNFKRKEDLTGLMCFGNGGFDKEYWNCIYTPSIGQKVSAVVLLCLDSAAVTTTSLLAIIRFIQLKDPFCIVKKKFIILSIVVAVTITACLQCTSLFSSKSKYSPLLMLTINGDPFGFGYRPWYAQYASILLTNSVIIGFQLAALISAMITACIIFRKQERNALGNNNLRRKQGSIKILLTNLPSFFILLRLTLEGPLMFIARQSGSGLYTEFQGWIIFSLHRMLPLLASSWNPVIFISLTPKTRKFLRSTFSLSVTHQPRSSGRGFSDTSCQQQSVTDPNPNESRP